MRVRDLMTSNVQTCGPEDNLGAAAQLMWDYDCGILPIAEGPDKVVGVITDRDICMAVATKNRPASEIAVREVISGELHSCRPEDEVANALDVMRTAKVRRLPVLNAKGELKGIVSMNDVVLKAEPATKRKVDALTADEVLMAFKAICERRLARSPEAAKSART